MSFYLIFLPYVLVPVVMVWLSTRGWLRSGVLQVLIPCLLLIAYPFVFDYFKQLHQPPPSAPSCAMPQFAFFLICLLFCLPASLVLQALLSFFIGLRKPAL